MCGIVGFTSMTADSKAVLDKMMESIIHRGPDGGGSYIDDSIAM